MNRHFGRLSAVCLVTAWLAGYSAAAPPSDFDAILQQPDAVLGVEDPPQTARKGDVSWASDGRPSTASKNRDASPIRLVQAAEPAQQPPTAGGPTTPTATDAATADADADNAYGLLGSTLLLGMQSVLDANPAAEGGADSTPLGGQRDASTLLQGVPGITSESHAPMINENTLRGRRLGQIPGKGSYWFPARQDLDTMMSKIDSQLVDRIVTYNGPYSAMYGPGFGFFDVQLLRAPHYAEGSAFETHAASALQYETNGEQWLGRQGFWGGDELWGFRGGYSHRGGSDYETGNGDQLPSSYKSRQADLALGSRLTTNSIVDFQYLRLDQTDVEFPGQFFDINALVTDAYAGTYVLENQRAFDSLTVDGWYNRTNFYGDNLRPGKRDLLPLDNEFTIPDPQNPGRTIRTTVVANSFTDVFAYSTGFRAGLSWGERDAEMLTAGVDLRYLRQRIDERNEITATLQSLDGNGMPVGAPDVIFLPSDNPLPKAHSSNPGLFAELQNPLTERLRSRTGVRVDWVSMNALEVVNGQDLEDVLGGDFDRDMNLGSSFTTLEYQATDVYAVNAGAGFAMRPPTMTEMYAVGPFVAVLPQYIFTSVFGDPTLDPEQMLQVDVGVSANYGSTRAGLQGYHAWVEDYITLDFLDNGFGSGAYAYVNTPLATLAGCEAYGECDIVPMVTAFSTLSFVEGRDHSRSSTISRQRQLLDPMAQNNQRSQPVFGAPTALSDEEPLPVIAPLASRVGFRFHAQEANPAWNVEFVANVVDNQDRVASSVRELITPGYTTYDILAFYRTGPSSVLTAGVRNLTDKYYQTYFDTRQAGTSPITVVFQPGINFVFGWEFTR